MQSWPRRGLGAALLAAAAVAAVPGASASPSPRSAPPSKVVLPGDVSAASVRRSADSWIVGSRRSPAARRLARRFGARSVVAGVYSVAPERARAFAGALRAARLLEFAEPDALMKRMAFPSDPLSPDQWALPAIRVTSLTPPPVNANSPTLAIMEADVQRTHPEFAGARISSTKRRMPAGEHGTAVTSLAAAPDNGRGIVGVWPGMKVLIAPSPKGTCSAAMGAIREAVRRGVAVINMSYGFENGQCESHRIATNAAFGAGTVLVAAAGNEFEEGNPSDQAPSADPHIITAAAVKKNLRPADFSNAHDGVDLSGPGVGVLAAVPSKIDTDDGDRDGYTGIDGTSFAAPIIAAAATWVVAERPNLDHTQVTDLMRYSARDLGGIGWERRFGFGMLDVPAALADEAPEPDPLEPNDRVRWIDGTHFKPDRPVHRGRKRPVRIVARLDRLDDPADVYRVILPARRSLKIAVKPREGETNVKVYRRTRAKKGSSRGRLVASSRRRGSRTDRVTLTNFARGRREAYVVVRPVTTTFLNAEYRLSLRRIPFARRGRALSR